MKITAPVFTYRVFECEVLDGDTVRAVIDLGVEVRTRGIFRLAGIDTPEKNRIVSREAALRAKNRLQALVTEAGAALVIRTQRGDPKEKYGRWLAWLAREGDALTFNDVLVSEGHAKPYDGGKKE